MRVLIIGGSNFLGRALTEAALKRGDHVTLFNRGKTNPDLFPDAEHIHGDRNTDLDLLRGRRWEAVVDTCGYTPRQLRASVGLLAEQTDHYTFISSISVYSKPDHAPLDEDSELGTLDQETDEVNGETYGPLKVASERAAEALMPGRVLNVRAGLLVGPYDYMDRFPFWVDRVARGGEVLAPGRPDRQVQVIDVRDLAAWIWHMAEAREGGSFNSTGPASTLTMRQMLNTINDALNKSAHFTWVADGFLQEHEVGAWEELPLWLPDSLDVPGILGADVRRAVAAGLHYRPLAETAADVAAWLKGIGGLWRPGYTPRAGLHPEKEAKLLSEWHATGASV
jgi:2'-hydroxyisoflavone reductase